MSKLRNFGREVFCFLTSGVFLRNILGMSIFLGITLFLLSIWMGWYTKHNVELEVHDYMGMDVESAEQLAEDRSFSMVIVDSIFLLGKKPNVILEQDPKPASMVKENRSIYVTISKNDPDIKILPDLAGGNDDFFEYNRKLKRIGVKTKIKTKKFRSKLEENTILEVWYNGTNVTDELVAGVNVEMGSTVEFVVSERLSNSVTVPNLKCKKFAEAEFIINNYNLNVGSIIDDESVTNRSNAYVVRQVPAYSERASMQVGQEVTLYLTQKKPSGCAGENIDIDNIEKPSAIEESDSGEVGGESDFQNG